MNQTIETIIRRRSVRSFSNQDVSDKDLDLILTAAKYAPSAMNIQDWHFTAVTNKQLLQELGELVAGAGETFFYHAPTLIIVSYKIETKSRFPEEDCACAMQNMMLVASSLGLASVWCNRLNKNLAFDGKLEAFGVPKGYRAYGSLALGYAAGPVPNDRPCAEHTVTIVR